MQVQTASLTEAKLQKLASDATNMVYTYTYDVPDGTMSAQAQLDHYLAMVTGFDGACRAFPTDSDEQLRDRVLASTAPKLDPRRFQHLYPKTFATSTVRARTPEEVRDLDKVRKGILYALQVSLHGDGDAEAKKARAMETALRLSLRPVRDTDAGGTHVDPASLPGGNVQPLAPEMLGDTMVRQ
jgi:hypothetical protein